MQFTYTYNTTTPSELDLYTKKYNKNGTVDVLDG